MSTETIIVFTFQVFIVAIGIEIIRRMIHKATEDFLEKSVHDKICFESVKSSI